MAWHIVLKEIQELRKKGFIIRFEKHGIDIEHEWENELGRNCIKRCILWIDFYETKLSPAEILAGVLNEMFRFETTLDDKIRERDEKAAIAAEEIAKKHVKPVKVSTEASQ